MGLAGKRVVVVGGTSGIGFATAAAAAADGASVTVASSDPARVAQALSRLPDGTGGQALDVVDEPAVAAFFASVGGFDHLVHTAGPAPAHDDPGPGEPSAWSAEQLSLPLLAVRRVAAHASAHLRPGGSIVLTSGQLAARPQRGMGLASVLAGAVEGLTRALAVELAPLRVNAVAPGVIRTERWQRMPPARREEFFRSIGGKLLTGHVGDPADVAEAYLFLMRSNFVTGAVVPVDGGSALV